MLRNHDYEEFPIKGNRLTFAYQLPFNQRNFSIRRLPFVSLISIGTQLSVEQIQSVYPALCEYASEYEAMDRYMEANPFIAELASSN